MLLIGKQRWKNGGAPSKCFRCQEAFDVEAVHGSDGHYYCSQQCREWEEGTVEKKARGFQ